MLPLVVDLTGAHTVVVGAGEVAARKIGTLLDNGARLTVVAPEAVDAIAEAARARRVIWERRRYAPGDLHGAVLAVAATGDADVNAAVAAEGAREGVLCVRADDGRGGTASFAASVRRGPLVLAVSTQGASPALARHVRQDLERRYGAEWGQLALLLAELRRDTGVQELLGGLRGPERAARWRSILDTDILALLREGHALRAKEVALSCLSSSSA